METKNFKYLKSNAKKRRKELVNEAAERLAEIFIKQIEKRKKSKNEKMKN